MAGTIALTILAVLPLFAIDSHGVWDLADEIKKA